MFVRDSVFLSFFSLAAAENSGATAAEEDAQAADADGEEEEEEEFDDVSCWAR